MLLHEVLYLSVHIWNFHFWAGGSGSFALSFTYLLYFSLSTWSIHCVFGCIQIQFAFRCDQIYTILSALTRYFVLSICLFKCYPIKCVPVLTPWKVILPHSLVTNFMDWLLPFVLQLELFLKRRTGLLFCQLSIMMLQMKYQFIYKNCSILHSQHS